MIETIYAVSEPLQIRPEKKKKDNFFSEIKKNKFLYFLTVPGVIYFIIFNYLPMVGIYIAFVDYNPMAKFYGITSKFIGLENFKFFFTSTELTFVLLNTLFLNILFISTGLFVQILMAVALNELNGKVYKRVAQSFMYLPNFLSWTVISIFSIMLFSTDQGTINLILKGMGLQGISFYQDPRVWPAILVILRLWKGVGFGTVIFLSTISGIDQEMFEAARIDGASRFKSIIYITLPLLKSTIVMLLILSVGSIFYGDFGMIYALVGDNPLLRSTTDVIDTFVYRALRVNNDVGMSSAVGIFQSLIGFIMVVSANAITRKLDKESSLF